MNGQHQDYLKNDTVQPPEHKQPRQREIFCFAALKTQNIPLLGALCEPMNPEVRKALEQMRARYEHMSYQDIASMGWEDMAPTIVVGKKYFPAVWSEVFPDNEALLVVQLTRWRFFKWFGSTDCIGFTLTPEGHRQYVDEYWIMHEVGHP